ncbi:hypothetical protein [Sphingobacterium sp. T2]|uniref:hypothetical protein n=1 Tax=Sphingobacterium sp. T2 TaxID=1590596 RepID=UPI000AD763C3|nr:hypothetical protein [Sphingobacterium sp. T2]
MAEELNLYVAKAGEDIAPYIADLAKQNNKQFSGTIKEAFDKSILVSKEETGSFLSKSFGRTSRQ